MSENPAKMRGALFFGRFRHVPATPAASAVSAAFCLDARKGAPSPIKWHNKRKKNERTLAQRACNPLPAHTQTHLTTNAAHHRCRQRLQKPHAAQRAAEANPNTYTTSCHRASVQTHEHGAWPTCHPSVMSRPVVPAFPPAATRSRRPCRTHISSTSDTVFSGRRRR